MGILNKYINKIKNDKNGQLLIQGTFVSVLGLIFLTLFQFLYLNLRTRTLDPGDVGLFALAYSIMILVFLISNGFSVSLLRFTSFFKGQKAEDKVKSTVVGIYKRAIPVFILILVCINIFADMIAINIYHQPGIAVLLRILSWGLFFRSITDLNIAVLKSRYMPKYEYLFRAYQFAIAFVLSLLLIIIDCRVEMFAFAFVTANLLVMIYSIIEIRKKVPILFNNKIKQVKITTPIFRFAFFSSLSNTLGKAGADISIFIIALFLSTADIALFDVVLKLSFLPMLFLNAMNTIFSAMVGTLHGKGDIAEIQRLHKGTALVLFLVSTAVFIAYYFGGNFILSLFGPFYVKALTPLLIITFSYVIFTGAGSIPTILNMLGRPYLNTINQALSLVLMVILCFLLIPIGNNRRGDRTCGQQCFHYYYCFSRGYVVV